MKHKISVLGNLKGAVPQLKLLKKPPVKMSNCRFINRLWSKLKLFVGVVVNSNSRGTALR